MDNFIGRHEELTLLEREYTRHNGFVVVYGRRRVGKTTLIQEFIKDKKALYLLATEEIEGENIKNFARALARFTDNKYLEQANFINWEALFEVLAQYQPKKKKILVIDEFQYLINANKAYASIFQRIWDTLLKNSNIMVILCGSLISMMLRDVLSYSSPLYGRRTAQIRLAPLTFTEFRNIDPNADYSKMVELYSVVGGVPKYIELFDLKKPLIENIENEILRKNSFLYEEPLFLLEKEVRDTLSYFSIIKTIALGNHKLSAICATLAIPNGSITPYIKTLMELEILEKRVPITEKLPEKSRKGRYYIKDNFINFWFKFIAPYKNELEIGNIAPVRKLIEEYMSERHTSFIFEDISREAVLQAKLGYNFNRIGAYWDSNIEIDICAINDEQKICLLGECKYKNKAVDIDVLSDLQAKSQRIPELQDYQFIYALFSKTGYTKRLREVEHVLLFNNGVVC